MYCWHWVYPRLTLWFIIVENPSCVYGVSIVMIWWNYTLMCESVCVFMFICVLYVHLVLHYCVLSFFTYSVCLSVCLSVCTFMSYVADSNKMMMTWSWRCLSETPFCSTIYSISAGASRSSRLYLRIHARRHLVWRAHKRNSLKVDRIVIIQGRYSGNNFCK